VHTFEIGVFNSLDINQFPFAPESDFGQFDGGRVDSEIDCLAWGGMVDLQLEVIDRDSSIGINGSVHSKAENIFDRLIRGFDLKCSEERTFFFESLLEPKIGDFLCGGMDLLVIIAIEFMIKNPLGLFDFGDILSDTGSDQSVLEPAIRSFNLPSGLRGKRVNDLYIAILKDLFPLRDGLIGEKVVLIPEGVSSPDKSKDGMRIDIVRVRESIAEDDRLEGQDMGPAGFFLDQNGIEHKSAIIIQGSDQIPFLLRGGSPEMMGGIMLNELSNIAG
jgi:hypothetical protein